MKSYKPLTQLVPELLQFFSAKGFNTSVSIAKEVGINQSQVYRNLFGAPKRLTKTHLKLCEYAKIGIETKAADPSTSSILMKALASIWDGSDDHANRLAELLFAHNRASVRK